jgi:hypothetical protein
MRRNISHAASQLGDDGPAGAPLKRGLAGLTLQNDQKGSSHA